MVSCFNKKQAISVVLAINRLDHDSGLSCTTFMSWNVPWNFLPKQIPGWNIMKYLRSLHQFVNRWSFCHPADHSISNAGPNIAQSMPFQFLNFHARDESQIPTNYPIARRKSLDQNHESRSAQKKTNLQKPYGKNHKVLSTVAKWRFRLRFRILKL